MKPERIVMVLSGTAFMLGWIALAVASVLHSSRLTSAGVVLLIAGIVVAGIPLLALAVAVALGRLGRFARSRSDRKRRAL